MRLPALTNDDAWQRLPGAPSVSEPLPAWARAWAGVLPITTARALELDAQQRTGDWLDNRTRAVARWAAADANRCPYGKAIASADFARTGNDPAKLIEPQAKADRLAAGFARHMMLDAAAVTDEEVVELIEYFGEERVMGLVSLVAHASYQDRALLALDIEPDAGGVPPPVTTRFARPKPTAPPPSLPLDADRSTPASAAWEDSRRGLDEQLNRPGRIRVPSVEAVRARIGANHPLQWMTGIVWSRVAYGYQPTLTDAWFDVVAAFRIESGLDLVTQNSVFWVVTESLRCFY